MFSLILKIFIGHRSVEIIAQYQPSKLAAMERYYASLAIADIYIYMVI